MSAHIAAVGHGSYYQLRQLRPLKRCIAYVTIKILTYVFIGSWLDYCNVQYSGGTLEPPAIRKQSVQNAAGHNTCPVAAPLAVGLSVCYVQAGDNGPLLTCRNCTGLPVW